MMSTTSNLGHVWANDLKLAWLIDSSDVWNVTKFGNRASIERVREMIEFENTNG